MDDAILAQQEEIKRQIAEKSPLVSPPEGLAGLEAEYKESPAFLAKIQGAKAKFAALRRVRGDGNCFYRAYMFAALEAWILQCQQNKHAEAMASLERLRQAVQGSKDRLVSLGFSEIAIEDFWETMLEELEWLRSSLEHANSSSASSESAYAALREQLEQKFNDRGTSDSLVMYARFLTSGQLKANKDDFAPYLPAGQTIESFCASEVEPMGKECDNLQCIALVKELPVGGVRVQYLDQSSGPLNHHDFGVTTEPQVQLLYRPGHYDVLYTQ